MLALSLVVLVVMAVAADRTIDGPGGLKIVVTKEGDCSQGTAENGDTLSMHYTGKLSSNGEKFDSSLDRGQTFDFPLGAGRVIQGWDKGLVGTCVGEKRTLNIPSAMGYGARGAGGVIPPNADLTFDVELVAVKKGRAEL